MICPNCYSTDHEEGVLYCHRCGTRLVAKTEFNKTSPEAFPPVRTFAVNGVSFNMIHVDGGTFMMGPPPEVYGGVRHRVNLDGFYIGEIPVTMELWNAVMGENAWKWHPYRSNVGNQKNVSPLVAVSGVEWEECKEFIDELSLLTHCAFRFPTEAEWEFAARGGNLSRNCKYSGTNSPNKVGGELYEPVKLGIPNELGLYDMSTGCQEWCYDWIHCVNSEPQINPRYDSPQSFSDIQEIYTHIVKGGRQPVWHYTCCASKLYNRAPYQIGLRLAM